VRGAAAHIGLITLELSGHLNPSTTLARELIARGHRVTLFARLDGEAKARAAGLGFEALGGASFPLGSSSAASDQLGRLDGTAALRYTLRLLGEQSHVLLTDAPERLRTAQVDLLLIDEISPAAEAVAEVLRIPYVTIYNALALRSDPALPPPISAWRYHPGRLARLRNRLATLLLEGAERFSRGETHRYRAAHGLPAHAGAMRRAAIAQQPAFFDFPRVAQPEWFHYAGPFHDEASGDAVDFPFDRLDGRPLIFASMGTLQNQQFEVFHGIAEACAGLDVQLVITLGRPGAELPPLLRTLPGMPLVVPYAPQRELLARAAVAITHAGLNTALEARVQGVPMVALPVTNDQPGVAARLAWLGAAEVVARAALEPAVLRRAIRRVLVEPSYRQAAEAARVQLARRPGAALAADIVERVLAR
jgi:MGT family glycosyltransferase